MHGFIRLTVDNAYSVDNAQCTMHGFIRLTVDNAYSVDSWQCTMLIRLTMHNAQCTVLFSWQFTMHNARLSGNGRKDTKKRLIMQILLS